MKGRSLNFYAGILLSALVGLAGFSSCSESNEPSAVQTKVQKVTMSIASRASAQITEAEKPEYQISTLRVYALDGNDLVGYYYNGTVGAGEHTFVMELPLKKLTIYVIANESATGGLKINNGADFILPGPTDGTKPFLRTLDVTPEKLKSLTFSTLPEAKLVSGNPDALDETGKVYLGAELPMTAVVEFPGTGSNIDISLVRSVAKMNLLFAKYGVENDVLYIGRGLYLYNSPQYGYLFNRNNATGAEAYSGGFNYLESDGGENTDSKLYQKGGKVILRSGWSDEPADSESAPNEQLMKTHINEITIFNNTSPGIMDYRQYQYMPAKPIYLFANPYEVPATENRPANPSESPQKGYYLKVMAHSHSTSNTGAVGHKGAAFYISLPSVKANDQLDVMSIVTVDGFIGITPHWVITPWTEGGADVEFN